MAKASKRKRASGAPQTETPYLSAGERRAKGKALRGTASRESVLEPYAGKSLHPHHGQRVVVGQRIMQTASDVRPPAARHEAVDDAIGEFTVEYSDQNRSDYRTFVLAVRDKRVEALVEN